VFGRLGKLLEGIMNERENKTLIFAETKRRCDDLYFRLKRSGYGGTVASCVYINSFSFQFNSSFSKLFVGVWV
jgi:superfamily II DNA/RNA helicase